jgi:hypothetical protein
VSHVVVAGLFPMVDRQRLTIVLAIETGPHAFYAAGLSPMVPRKDDSTRFRHNIRMSRRSGYEAVDAASGNARVRDERCFRRVYRTGTTLRAPCSKIF